MIHSLSGGVIAENGVHTFVKVDVMGTPCWYLSARRLPAGTRVAVPYGKAGRPVEGKVLRCEDCTPQTAPVPFARARTILRVVQQETEICENTQNCVDRQTSGEYNKTEDIGE